MLNPASWLAAAQELPEGSKRRTDHDCGGGRTLLVEHKENGWAAWCHRCSDDGFHPHPRPSMAERIARLSAVAAADTAASQDTRPPGPMNFDPSSWPIEARVWLYKAGLSNEIITANGFYWCERIHRVVLPVLHDGRLLYWQARGFDPAFAKYINPPIDKSGLVAKYGSGTTLVLTEDMLSAIRVGGCSEAWSLLGTSLSDAVARRIAELRRPVAIWLDPDGAGRKARGKVYRTLSRLGVDARIVRTDKDPKLYSMEEITQFLLI